MSYGPEFVSLQTHLLSKLKGRKVQRIDAADNYVLITFSKDISLLVSWDTRSFGVSLIDNHNKKELLDHATHTPSILNALKSNLTGAVITDVKQINRDRIISIMFRKTIGMGFYTDRELIIEAMERMSNVLLLDEDKKILETVKHVYPENNTHRTILPGTKYVAPPKLNGITIEDWLKFPSFQTLPMLVGLGKKLTRHLEKFELSDVTDIVSQYYQDDFSSFCITKFKNYTSLLPRAYTNTPCKLNISYICKEETFNRILQQYLEASKKNVRKFIDKELLRRERQLKDINKLLTKSHPEKYKQYGDAIVFNLWQIQQGETDCNLSYYEEDGTERTVNVPLNIQLSPSKNAEKYFEKYKKILKSQENASKLISKVQSEINYFNEELILLECADDINTVEKLQKELGITTKTTKNNIRKSSEQQEPPYKKFFLTDAIIYAGLSAKGNRHVTFKLAKPEDIWFHAQGIPGSHVILRTTEVITDERKEFLYSLCGSIAVNYSKTASGNTIRVDYTNKKFISPIKGEIANVTYKNFNTLRADNSLYKESFEEMRSTLREEVE